MHGVKEAFLTDLPTGGLLQRLLPYKQALLNGASSFLAHAASV